MKQALIEWYGKLSPAAALCCLLVLIAVLGAVEKL